MFVWRFDPPEEAERGCNTLTVVPNPNVVTPLAGAAGAVTDEDEDEDEDEDDEDEDEDDEDDDATSVGLSNPLLPNIPIGSPKPTVDVLAPPATGADGAAEISVSFASFFVSKHFSRKICNASIKS